MKKNVLLRMNLQLFSADLGSEGNPGNPDDPAQQQNDPADPKPEESGKEKTFTRDDISKMIAAEKSKWEKEYQERLDAERNEAARLAKLSENERQKALFSKEKEEFEKEKEKFRRDQLFIEKGKQLSSEGMPAEFAHRIIGDTAEEILEDVKTFRKEWDEAIEKAVNLRLAQKPVKKGTAGTGLTKAEIMNISDPIERQRAIAENRHLF